MNIDDVESVLCVQKMDAMGHLVDDLIARTHELLQPNPGWLMCN